MTEAQMNEYVELREQTMREDAQAEIANDAMLKAELEAAALKDWEDEMAELACFL